MADHRGYVLFRLNQDDSYLQREMICLEKCKCARNNQVIFTINNDARFELETESVE